SCRISLLWCPSPWSAASAGAIARSVRGYGDALEYDVGARRQLAQRLFDLLAGIEAGRVVVTEVVHIRRHVEVADVLGGAMQERVRGIAARHHQGHVVHLGDWVHHAGKRVLLQPNFNVTVGLCPKALPVEFCGLAKRLLYAIEGTRLALPPRAVRQMVVG